MSLIWTYQRSKADRTHYYTTDAVHSYVFSRQNCNDFQQNASYLQLVGGFSGYSGPPKKTDHHETNGIMFKVALNTIVLIQIFLFFMGFGLFVYF
jgi:hypothetical protein